MSEKNLGRKNVRQYGADIGLHPVLGRMNFRITRQQRLLLRLLIQVTLKSFFCRCPNTSELVMRSTQLSWCYIECHLMWLQT